MQSGFAFSKFANRLASLAELSCEDIDLLARMPSTISHHPSHAIVLQASEPVPHCCLLLQGYLCLRSDDSSHGQIISIHVPGDVPDLHTFQMLRSGAHLGTLGPAVVALVPHSFFQEAAAHSPSLSRSLSMLMLADSAALRNWVVNLGSRDALTRVAHLLCDIAMRLRAVGLAKDLRFPSPFTQADLGSACGISPVHANRVVQELRRRDLLQWEAREITITDWKALTRVAAFRPDYLWLRQPEAVLPQLSRSQPEERAGLAVRA
jgi:CRP-like cAMP-binding protein